MNQKSARDHFWKSPPATFLKGCFKGQQQGHTQPIGIKYLLHVPLQNKQLMIELPILRKVPVYIGNKLKHLKSLSHESHVVCGGVKS